VTSGNENTTVASLLAPQTVPIIGASDDVSKFSGRILKQLMQHAFKGRIYPINPHRDTVPGLRPFRGVGAVPEALDAVVMAVPRDDVALAVNECTQAGARNAIAMTAKFSDEGAEGANHERDIVLDDAVRATPAWREVSPRRSGSSSERLSGLPDPRIAGAHVLARAAVTTDFSETLEA
jgi:predicted CoA-binding protein